MKVLVQDGPQGPHAQAGEILDLPDAEAKDMILRGTAIPVPEPAPVKPRSALAAPDTIGDVTNAQLEMADPDPIEEQPSPDIEPGKVRRRVKRPAATSAARRTSSTTRKGR